MNKRIRVTIEYERTVDSAFDNHTTKTIHGEDLGRYVRLIEDLFGVTAEVKISVEATGEEGETA